MPLGVRVLCRRLLNSHLFVLQEEQAAQARCWWLFFGLSLLKAGVSAVCSSSRCNV